VVRDAAWVAASVLSGVAASLYLELRATSALSLALVAGAAWLHAAAPEPTRPREGAASAALGALFALFAVAGRLSERGDWIRYLAHRTVVPGRVSAVVYAGVFAGLALLFRSAILVLGSRLDGASIRERAVLPDSEHRVRLLAWAMILGCWAPYLLCTWPGVLTPDSRSQVLQALGRVPLNDHHPIAHTLLVAGALRLGEIVFGSLEAGLATYSVAQAALLSWTFAWIAGRLHREGVRSSVLVAAVAAAAAQAAEQADHGAVERGILGARLHLALGDQGGAFRRRQQAQPCATAIDEQHALRDRADPAELGRLAHAVGIDQIDPAAQRQGAHAGDVGRRNLGGIDGEADVAGGQLRPSGLLAADDLEAG